ncbi:hypothetical protein DKG77_10130 [Flagellimonas aquimarina]|jgi:hypothetical protein|uniref:Uncharacterized protein n=2 Tax=Flagellimonas aquimarina TaxID=2201895 RepID=A0A316KWJ7_9FLAO|nr:hypothetical protein DKG77_10130 [Allomuricauda koreensis]
MENNEYIHFIIGGLLHGISHLAVITACIIMLIKQKNSATILMLTASILTLLFSVGSIIWNRIAAYNGAESLVQATKIISILGAIPYILFALGLLLFAVRHLRKSTAV